MLSLSVKVNASSRLRKPARRRLPVRPRLDLTAADSPRSDTSYRSHRSHRTLCDFLTPRSTARYLLSGSLALGAEGDRAATPHLIPKSLSTVSDWCIMSYWQADAPFFMSMLTALLE